MSARPPADTALAELAASIAAHGLLNNLVVRKDRKGKHAVIAGGRRLAALQLVADEGRIAKDHPVPCQLRGDDADHSELSLVENTLREQMHPADEFEAFRDLVDNGTPVEDIAARFSVTPRTLALILQSMDYLFGVRTSARRLPVDRGST